MKSISTLVAWCLSAPTDAVPPLSSVDHKQSVGKPAETRRAQCPWVVRGMFCRSARASGKRIPGVLPVGETAMPTIVKPICIATVLLALGACSKLGVGQDQMSWAREALARNDRLEIVAADDQAKT